MLLMETLFGGGDPVRTTDGSTFLQQTFFAGAGIPGAKKKLTLCSTNQAKAWDWSCLLPFS